MFEKKFTGFGLAAATAFAMLTAAPTNAADLAHSWEFDGDGQDDAEDYGNVGDAPLRIFKGDANQVDGKLELRDTTPHLNNDYLWADVMVLETLGETIGSQNGNGQITIETWFQSSSQAIDPANPDTLLPNDICSPVVTMGHSWESGYGERAFRIEPKGWDGDLAILMNTTYLKTGLVLEDDKDYYVSVTLDDANDKCKLYVGWEGDDAQMDFLTYEAQMNDSLDSIGVGYDYTDTMRPFFGLGAVHRLCSWEGPWPAFRDWTGDVHELNMYTGDFTVEDALNSANTGPVAIPEPSAAALAALGLCLFAGRRRRNA